MGFFDSLLNGDIEGALSSAGSAFDKKSTETCRNAASRMTDSQLMNNRYNSDLGSYQSEAIEREIRRRHLDD